MKKLIDDPIGPDLEELLRSAELDVPREADKRQDRILAAIAAAPMSVATASSAARRPMFLRAAKWSLPLVGAAIVVTATRWTTTENGSSTKNVTASAPSTEQILPIAPPASESPATNAPPAQSMRVEDLPAVAASAAPSVRAHPEASVARRAAKTVEAPLPTSPTTPTADPGIESELAAIDAARGSLAAGRSSETLTRVADYRRTFPSPHFADEADALEIRALAALGRTDEARQKAERFLSSHAKSPYAQRVRSAVGLKD